MKQDYYNLIVKCVTFGAPVLAKDIIQDLNTDLQELDQLKQSSKTGSTVDNKEEK